MKKNTPNSISQNVKKYRLLNKMTQEELAELLDLDTQYYAQLERGERNFTIEKLIRLCNIFHIGIENLIEVNTSTDTASEELIEKLTSQIKSLSSSQLIIVEKFISDFVPYIK